jgi:hypothetical protein
MIVRKRNMIGQLQMCNKCWGNDTSLDLVSPSKTAWMLQLALEGEQLSTTLLTIAACHEASGETNFNSNVRPKASGNIR